MKKLWLALALPAVLVGCSGSPSSDIRGRPAAGGADAVEVDSGAAGAAGMSGAGGSGGSGSAGAGGANVQPDSGPPSVDATSDSTGNNGPDGGAPEAGAVADAGSDSRPAVDAGPDSAPDAVPVPPEAGKDGGSDVVIDRVPDSVPATDAKDGALPPTCNYVIEPIPEVTWPHALCGTTTSLPNGTYQFSNFQFRRPINTPGPIDEFTGGTMTVKNGSSVKTYPGSKWNGPLGEDAVIYRDPSGTAPIVFTTGVQEISVISTDASGKRGCLPEPCTWTVTQ